MEYRRVPAPRELPPKDSTLVIPGTASLIGSEGGSRLADALGTDVLKGRLTIGRVLVSAKP